MVASTQLFGGASAPVNFARYPSWCCGAVAVLAAIAMDHCVDDLLCVEPLCTIDAAYRFWRGFADLCGWDVPDAKSPPPSRLTRLLGAISDLRLTPMCAPCFRIAEDRAEKISRILKMVAKCNKLTPALAGNIWGQLGFSQTAMCGRFGRAMLRAFKRRQYERGRYGLNEQILATIRWWIDVLKCPPERPIYSDLERRPTVVSYSDGEGAMAQVGIAVWPGGGRDPIGGVIKVPQEIRDLWDWQQSLARHNDIYEVEAIGPLLLLFNWPELFRDTLWLHFIDNQAALASLVKGSSSVHSGDVIVGQTWRLAMNLNTIPWFDRVDSKSNPVDGLSRGKLEGPWRLQQIRFPLELLSDLKLRWN